MSHEQEQAGYIKAVLEQQNAVMSEMRKDIRDIKDKLDNGAVQFVHLKAEQGILRDEIKRQACPAPGKCILLETDLNALKAQVAQIEQTKNAAFSVWKVAVGICVFFAGLAGFIYAAVEIASKLLHKP